MGLSISKFITSNFAKKTVTKFFEQTSNIVEAAKPIKLVKGKLTYLFNPNTVNCYEWSISKIKFSSIWA